VRYKLAATLLTVALLPAIGCGGKERISLSARVRNVELEVQEDLLGTFLSGQFDLLVRLGPNASESTTAELESVSLVRTGGAPTLVAALPLTTLPGPIEVRPGQERTLSLVLEDSEPIAADMREQICSAPVQITGSLTDTLSDDGSTPFSSPEQTPDGCN
jgi:hypothetical protein